GWTDVPGGPGLPHSCAGFGVLIEHGPQFEGEITACSEPEACGGVVAGVQERAEVALGESFRDHDGPPGLRVSDLAEPVLPCTVGERQRLLLDVRAEVLALARLRMRLGELRVLLLT